MYCSSTASLFTTTKKMTIKGYIVAHELDRSLWNYFSLRFANATPSSPYVTTVTTPHCLSFYDQLGV